MERRLAAILAADVVGYTRLMGEDEAGTLRRLTELREGILEPLIAEHAGRVVKLMGDGLLVEFASLVDAVRCAVAWQTAMTEHEAVQPEDGRFSFRIGVNLGDVLVEGEDIHGDGVNIATRLEGLAAPGGICLSGDAYRQARGKVEAAFEDLGDQSLKNVAEPVRVYRVLLNGEAHVPQVAKTTLRKSPWQWIAVATGIALVLTVTTLIWYLRPQPVPAPQDKPSIAVLPFENKSDDPNQEYFADGITEEIYTTISRIRELNVISGNSTYVYKGQVFKLEQIVQDLGVRYVFQGSVRKAENRLRITARLTDADKKTILWTGRYDGELERIFKLQDEFVLNITSAIYSKLLGLAGKEARPPDRTTNKFEAWELYIRADWNYRTATHESILRARELLEQAVKIDEKFAAAWGRIARTHLIEMRRGWSQEPKRSYGLAKEFAEKALALEPDLPIAHIVMAYLHLYARRHDEAIAAGKRAHNIDPNNTAILFALGDIMRYSSRFEEGIELIERAKLLNPKYPQWYPYSIGMSRFHLSQYEASIKAFEEVLHRDPSYDWAHAGLALNFGALGRWEDARREADAAIAINPKISLRWIREVVPYKDRAIIEQITRIYGSAGIPE